MGEALKTKPAHDDCDAPSSIHGDSGRLVERRGSSHPVCVTEVVTWNSGEAARDCSYSSESLAALPMFHRWAV